MGYDDLLGDKLGITLIATGFEHKDTLGTTPLKKVAPQEEKIIMVLGQPSEPSASAVTSTTPVGSDAATIMATAEVAENSSVPDALMPRLIEEVPPVIATDAAVVPQQETIIHFELSSDTVANEVVEVTTSSVRPAAILETDASYLAAATPATTGPAAGGYLTRPANIYAEPPMPVAQATSVSVAAFVEAPAPAQTANAEIREQLSAPATTVREDILQPALSPEIVADENSVVVPVMAASSLEEPEEMQMQLIEKEELSDMPTPLLYEIHTATPSARDEGISIEDTFEQQRRAADRLQKLRNLSFNVNAADPNNEFETVPAYIRRNMELYNSSSQIENFYSNYEVKEDPSSQGPISTLNTFLNGKKPD
jgi:cell division protein FtsZ